MAAAANDSTLPAIGRNPSFVADESDLIGNTHLPIIDLVDHEWSRQIQLESTPRIVQFEKFTPGIIYSRNVKVRNTSTKIQRTYISNPMTKWFAIKVNKEHNLLPGLDLTILLKFKPDKERYYYDRLRISYQSGDSLFIPIHAFPILPSIDFPKLLELRKSSIGEISMYTIPITCSSPIELRFHLEFQPHLTCCQVAPVKGILYPGIPVEVLLKFKPEFSANFQQNLNLSISNIELNILTCKIIYNQEKSRRDKIKSHELKRPSKTLRVKKISPVLNVSPKRKEIVKVQKEDLITTVESSQIPSLVNIYCVESKNKKEKQFIEAQKQIQEEEKNIQSKRHVKLGSLPLSFKERQMIFKLREISWEKFKQKELLVDKDGLNRHKVNYGTAGALLDIKDKPKIHKFSFTVNNEWPTRLLTLRRFRNAVKRVMTRFRASKRLAILRQILKDGKAKEVPVKPKELENKFSMCLDNIKPQNISKLFYCPENYGNLWPGLKPTDPVPLNFGNWFKHKPVPITQPLLHEILGYKLQDVHEAGINYIPMAPKQINPEPNCAMERVTAFVEARNRFSKHDKVSIPKDLFEMPVMDSRKYFNPYPEIPEIIPLPIISNLEEEYALYPLNTWQRKDDVRSVTSIEELAENIQKCQNITIPAEASDEIPETKPSFPLQAQFKLELPLVDANEIEETEKLIDETSPKDTILKRQALAGATTAEEILTCDNHSHTSSSTSPN